MQTYEDFIPYTGDGERAIDIALQTLLPLGFRIESQGSSHLTVTNQHYNSTKQDALMGITRAEFDLSRSALTVRAELGGVERMQKFLLFILLGLGAFDVLLFTGLWYFIPELHAQTWFLFIPLVALIPWAIIAPRMTVWIRERTVSALQTLLSNIASSQ